MSDLKDTGPLNDAPGGGSLPEEQLMAYLEGRLSPEEEHGVEEWLSNEGMESDALEGLQAMTPEETRQITSRLNYSLNQSLKEKKRPRRPLMDQRWAWLSVAIVLLLAIMGFAVIYLMNRRH
jgi:anti-sigma factor RsiW